MERTWAGAASADAAFRRMCTRTAFAQILTIRGINRGFAALPEPNSFNRAEFVMASATLCAFA